jgi:hypothetical protein
MISRHQGEAFDIGIHFKPERSNGLINHISVEEEQGDILVTL